jgi:hypothetical protein
MSNLSIELAELTKPLAGAGASQNVAKMVIDQLNQPPDDKLIAPF